MRTKQKEEETYYLQTFNPFPNEQGEKPYITHKVKPPRGRRIVDGPADWLAMDKVVCHIPPKTKGGEETLKAQKEANKNEAWGQALLNYMALIQPYYLRSLAKQLPLRGETWLRIETDWNYIKNPDNFEGVPFKWVVPDSMMLHSTLDLDAYSRPLMLFEDKVHTYGHLKSLVARWNKGRKEVKLPFKDIKDYQDITLVEWWTPEARGYFAGLGGITEASWYAVPIDGEQIVPNLETVIPYIRGFSPLGMWPYDGDISKLVVGFLRPMGDVIIQDSRDRSKIDTITNFWAAPIVSWIIEEGIKLEDADTTIAPGIIYTQIRNRKELKIEPPPTIPSSLLQQIGLNEALLEEYDPMVLRGRGQPGETAVGQSQRVGLGLQKWEPLKITLKQMIANAISTVFKIVEEMDVPVKIAEFVLKKEDIKGNYTVSVDIKPGNPEEQVRRMLLAKDLGDLYSDEDRAEKFLGEENATEFVRKTRVSKMLNLMLQTPGSPLWTLVYNQAMSELGMEDIQAELEARAQEQAKQTTLETPVGKGPVIGGHPTRGAPGVASEPPVAMPQGQEELEGAMNAMQRLS